MTAAVAAFAAVAGMRVAGMHFADFPMLFTDFKNLQSSKNKQIYTRIPARFE